MAESVFTLEALEAKHGDSLLLHYGTLDAPRLIVIDGGPRRINVSKRVEDQGRHDSWRRSFKPSGRYPTMMRGLVS